MAPTATPTAARTPTDIPATCSVDSVSGSSLSSSLLAPPAPPTTSVLEVVSVSDVVTDVEVLKVVDLVIGGSVIEMISESVVASSEESVEGCSSAVDRVVDLIVVFVDGLGITGGDDVSMTRVVGNVRIVLDVSELDVVLVLVVTTEGKVTTPPPEGAKTKVAVMVRWVGCTALGFPRHMSYAFSMTRSGSV